jgi:TP53 regulating kinase-like protein
LGGKSSETEDKGVDLHLFQRTMESSHHSIFEDAFNAFLEGYVDTNPSAKTVIQRLWEIDSRGRYTSRKPQIMRE